MNVNDYAVPYAWQGVTLYFMPYRTLAVETMLRALERIVPHYEYVNSKTGAISADKPEELGKAERVASKRAQLSGKVAAPRTHWTRRDLWTTAENTFVMVLPRIVAVEFPDTLSAEARSFKAVWDMRGDALAPRWETYALLIGTATINALWTGLEATRDRSFEPVEAVETETEADDPDADAPLSDAG